MDYGDGKDGMEATCEPDESWGPDASSITQSTITQSTDGVLRVLEILEVTDPIAVLVTFDEEYLFWCATTYDRQVFLNHEEARAMVLAGARVKDVAP
jgi:hypothetical protein